MYITSEPKKIVEKEKLNVTQEYSRLYSSGKNELIKNNYEKAKDIFQQTSRIADKLKDRIKSLKSLDKLSDALDGLECYLDSSNVLTQIESVLKSNANKSIKLGYYQFHKLKVKNLMKQYINCFLLNYLDKSVFFLGDLETLILNGQNIEEKFFSIKTIFKTLVKHDQVLFQPIEEYYIKLFQNSIDGISVKKVSLNLKVLILDLIENNLNILNIFRFFNEKFLKHKYGDENHVFHLMNILEKNYEIQNRDLDKLKFIVESNLKSNKFVIVFKKDKLTSIDQFILEWKTRYELFLSSFKTFRKIVDYSLTITESPDKREKLILPLISGKWTSNKPVNRSINKIENKRNSFNTSDLLKIKIKKDVSSSDRINSDSKKLRILNFDESKEDIIKSSRGTVNITQQRMLSTTPRTIRSKNLKNNNLLKLHNPKSLFSSPGITSGKEINYSYSPSPIIELKSIEEPIKIDNYSTSNSTTPDTKGNSISMFNYEKYYKSLKKLISDQLNQQCDNKSHSIDIKIPNFVIDYSSVTVSGRNSLGKEKQNQDSFFAYENFFLIKNFYYFGVCDGHGVDGHLASEHAREYLASNFHYLEIERNFNEKNGKYCSNFKELCNSLSNEIANLKQKENVLKYIYDKLNIKVSNFSFVKKSPHKIITETFRKTHEDIKNRSFDSECSGTTVCSIFILGNKLFCANLGDSRAILAQTGTKNNEYIITALSKDHKPDDKEEKKRIINNNGRIDRFKDEYDNPSGPSRVWLKNEDTPGLAMTRSIGDCIASTVGIIPDPEITEHTLTNKDKLVIIASDGIWEYISNEKAVEIVWSFLNKSALQAANELVDAAIKLWSLVSI